MITRMNKKPLICITTGEPAGIGPEICLDLVNSPYVDSYNLLLIGDVHLLSKRAELVGKYIDFIIISDPDDFPVLKCGQLAVFHIDCPNHDCIGCPLAINASYVLNTLNIAIDLCKKGMSKVIVTAPVNKDVLNHGEISFSGHTEYFAEKFGVKKVVMMLANNMLRVALLTTHIPLADVPSQITSENLDSVIRIIHDSFTSNFNQPQPRIAVCGLNPHAGENGHLGMEEINIINPVIKKWQQDGYLVSGCYPADTIFNRAREFDVILAMYHDQGLPVLKYSGFETGVNITLGLPIIRTSVDHGTALDLAGTGKALSASLHSAIEIAIQLSSTSG